MTFSSQIRFLIYTFFCYRNGVEGFIIKTEEQDGETGQSGCNWWTEEQLQHHIQNNHLLNPLPGVSGDYDHTDFEKRMTIMETILRDEPNNIDLIHKRVLTIGYGEQVQEDSTISFHLTGYVENSDEPFDSSELRNKPFLVRLSNSIVLPGIFFALTSMKVGEKAEFIIHPSLGFGKQGVPPRVPGDSRLLYVITIRMIHKEGTLANYLTKTEQELRDIPLETILKLVESEKDSGNCYFQRERFSDALTRYRRAVKFLQEAASRIDSFDQVKGTLVKLCTNSANAALRIERYKACIKFCKRALELDPENTKAMYHWAKAQFFMGKLSEARDLLVKIDQLQPGNQEVYTLLYQIAKKESSDFQESKKLAELMGRALLP